MMIKSQSIPPDPICEPCIFEKQHRHNIPKTASHKSHILDLVHKDLKGPMPVQTAEGEHYWELFIDDMSQWKIVAFLRQKSDALVAFKLYKAEAEKQERKFCLPGMTREVNLLAMNIMNSVLRELNSNTLNLMNHIKEELQSVPIEKL
jgi:hypothetical protein